MYSCDYHITIGLTWSIRTNAVTWTEPPWGLKRNEYEPPWERSERERETGIRVREGNCENRLKIEMIYSREAIFWKKNIIYLPRQACIHMTTTSRLAWSGKLTWIFWHYHVRPCPTWYVFMWLPRQAKPDVVSSRTTSLIKWRGNILTLPLQAWVIPHVESGDLK